MRPPSRARFVALASLTVIAACGIVTEPTSVVDPATLIFFGDTAAITSPDTVDRATPFTVRVRTFGGGCTHAVARTDVGAGDLTAEIRPYNLANREHGISCTPDLYFLDHVATIRFAMPGVGLIRIIGVEYTAAAPNSPSAVILERRVVVR